MSMLTFRVAEIRDETPRVRCLILESTGGALPGWEAGAHIRVALPQGGDRPYSLVALPGLGEGRYALGVLREDPGTGGSAYVHGLSVGDTVTSGAPVNQFAMTPGDGPVTLLAGGIGITPILSMAGALKAGGRPFRLYYFGRAEGELAFLPDLATLCGDSLTTGYDSVDGPPDLGAILAATPAGADLYVCGPGGMIEAMKTAWAEEGRPAERLHYELFTATPPPAAGDQPFEVEIASTGKVVTVAPAQTIIEALEEAGVDVVYDCQRGDCGICQTGVISGVPEHRDVVLSDEEKASNKVMQICVSRAVSPRLVLDL
ncbi:PDR/VanB family oxidoreductase [Acidimangrovimonas sediminis]|uniref:PDR/VanB family oxidoreductase n=1 Tax=Acidimangrovimonas sediminis TaxID=2056283 RepID=UPI001E5FF761|nr:PDR/VanB family oxidoreductase [Acidimangrovimonas sediminis]